VRQRDIVICSEELTEVINAFMDPKDWNLLASDCM